MYHTALPLQWSYLQQPMLDPVPCSLPLFFTGCTKLYPVFPTENKNESRVTNGRKTLLPSPTLESTHRHSLPTNNIQNAKHSSEQLVELQQIETDILEPEEEPMPVKQISIETLLGVKLEKIIQLVNSTTEKHCPDRPVSEDLASDKKKSESVSRGLKRHLDPESPFVQTSEGSPINKRQKHDENEPVTASTPKEKIKSLATTLPDSTTEEASSPNSSPSKLGVVSQDDICDRDLLEKVSKLIWRIYLHNKQSDEMFLKKTKLRDALLNLLKNVFPYCGLYIVGSSLNTLGTNCSDLDMCLMLSPSEIDQSLEATNILNTILQILDRCEFVESAQLIPAKVPILKFFDTVSGVEVDLNINNAVGIRNTQLMHCYARVDWRVKPLVVLVKMWAKEQDINDAKNMTLSSYSLVLMVLHFLQCGATPSVLPSLQVIMPTKFSPHSDVRHLTLGEELPLYKSNNTANLGDLMLQFLHYFSQKFRFNENAISVRTGGMIPKQVAMNCPTPKNKRGHWKYISIEEPFDRTNTARSVFNEAAFNRILIAFRTSFEILKETVDLSSILDVDYHLL